MNSGEQSVPESVPEMVTLMTCDTRDEAALVRYGLKLRQIPSAVSVPRGSIVPGRKPRPIEVLVPRESLKRAREAIDYITGAVHGDGIAVTPDQRCAFCAYDMSGLGSITICPECGTDLASESAKRLARRRIAPDA